MFNNMKNKIREKTGAELPKFIPPSTMFNKSKSNQHSRQSSLGSINSIASDQGCKEESETKSLNNTEKEDIAIIVNLENKLVEKEKEWREKEKSYIADLQKQRKELAEALALVEENKRKLLCCQEEKDELEVYQKEEISKIKELLLAKEEENNGNMKELKVALSLIEKLKQDVARLTPLEEKINNYQNDINVDENEKLSELTAKIEVLSKENEALRLSNEESRRILDNSLRKEIAKNNNLNAENFELKEYNHELDNFLEQERKVKDGTLLRNAEISQKVQLIDQELKEQQNQNEELFKKVVFLEEQLENANQKIERLRSAGNMSEEILKEKMKEMENEINDKNKSLHILQQHLTDVRKTFQSELKNNLETNKTSNVSSSFADDINFKYMKHVLIKFLTSSEYEALQLTKAVATLLKLSSEEERLIKESLDWRSSWFGSKPHVRLHNNHS